MASQPQKSSRLAAAIVVAALVVAAAILASSSLGTKTTVTATQTVTTTAISNSLPIPSTQSITSTTLFSSVGTDAALVLSSIDGLGLGLQVLPGLNGNYTITVKDTNLLDSVNDLQQYGDWAYPRDSLNPANPCGPGGITPVGLAVLQGNYGPDNYTSAPSLPFYDPSDTFLCGAAGFSGPYYFLPLSDYFELGSNGNAEAPASVILSTNGYWTAGQNNVQAAFKPFPPGVYTVVGADEWGNVALLQFSVPAAIVSVVSVVAPHDDFASYGGLVFTCGGSPGAGAYLFLANYGTTEAQIVGITIIWDGANNAFVTSGSCALGPAGSPTSTVYLDLYDPAVLTLAAESGQSFQGTVDLLNGQQVQFVGAFS